MAKKRAVKSVKGQHMLLLRVEDVRSLPPLYSTEKVSAVDKVCPVKLFDPAGSATWYLVEYDPEKQIAFAFVTGLGEDEWGYVDVSELAALKGRLGIGIERDKFWKPQRMSEVWA